jgi:DNA-binding transcriptional LysR family regulator
MARGRLGGIDLNLLHALEALLDERNVTRAGQRIQMSQPAMSSALARLRVHFGDDLLVRVGRGYELTALAQSLGQDVRRALDTLESALSPELGFDATQSDRRFSVAASDYAVTVVIEPLLALMAQRAPRARVEFEPIMFNNDEADSWLRRCDVVLTATGFGVPGRRLEVFRDRFVCMTSTGNPWIRDGRLDLAALAEIPHAVANFGDQPTPAEARLAELGVKAPIGAVVSGLLQLPFAVAGTDLCAFVPERLALQTQNLLDLQIVEVPTAGDIELVEAAHWHPSRAKEPGLQWFRSLLREVRDQLTSPIAPV